MSGYDYLSNLYNEKLDREFVQQKRNSGGVNTNKSIWSEGLERRINTITLGKDDDPVAQKELVADMSVLGEKLGFKVEESDINKSIWMEDFSIRRADGKIYIIPQMKDCKDKNFRYERLPYTLLSQIYATKCNQADIVRGKSYLEGGNVLNTVLKNGEAGAIIGYASLQDSMTAMNMENTQKDSNIVGAQIAKDLGIKMENITYIPQCDFHIDMFYRPLKNGEVALPDYDEAIKILKNTKISNMPEHVKVELITTLNTFKNKNAELLKVAQEQLSKGGYKLHKIPCFTVPSQMRDPANINYANGICGKDKNGKYYIITNKSKYKELDEKVAEYYKKAGVDDVYFVGVKNEIKYHGGIDCRTQEY